MTGLSPDEIDRVRDSFDRLWPTSAQTAGLFYERLFEIAPEVQPLFRHDIDEQKRKFIATLAVIVGSLDDRSKLIALTGGLARQHGNFGVQAAHYSIVGEALLWSLARGLGDAWTPSVAASWRKAYGIISTFMIEHGSPN